MLCEASPGLCTFAAQSALSQLSSRIPQQRSSSVSSNQGPPPTTTATNHQQQHHVGLQAPVPTPQGSAFNSISQRGKKNATDLRPELTHEPLLGLDQSVIGNCLFISFDLFSYDFSDEDIRIILVVFCVLKYSSFSLFLLLYLFPATIFFFNNHLNCLCEAASSPSPHHRRRRRFLS